MGKSFVTGKIALLIATVGVKSLADFFQILDDVSGIWFSC